MTGTPRTVALCAAVPERMFPVAESKKTGQVSDGERRALAICQACPLLAECQAVVLGMELPYGVAGGLTAADRRAVRAGGRGSDAGVVAA
ncbi:WhiB family transcriptional regulator [Streptomyces sp. NPDC048558]